MHLQYYLYFVASYIVKYLVFQKEVIDYVVFQLFFLNFLFVLIDIVLIFPEYL
uniref:Candidate secreted effector n=1 Tax=Meloidogyne incognita TaxID=6306 RepID=A0A914NMX9_MELIC